MDAPSTSPARTTPVPAVPLCAPGREPAVLLGLCAAFAVAGGLLARARHTGHSPVGSGATRGALRVRVLAMLSGAAPAAAFPAPDVWPLGFVGLVPLMLVIRAAPTGRDAAVRAWWGGTGFFLAACYWLAPNTGPFLLILAVALGTTWLLWGRLAWAVLHEPPSPKRFAWALLVVPSAWVMGEFIRSWQGLGGPWALLGASQWNTRPVLALASVGGVWLLSFLLVAVALALAAMGVPGASARMRAAAGAAAAGIVAVGLGTAATLAPPATTGTLRVGGAQPGVVHQPEARFAASEAATLALAEARPGLVVWGESSVGFDLADDPAHSGRIAALARVVGADILVNTDARRSAGVDEPASGDPGVPLPGPGRSPPPGMPVQRAGGIYKTAVLVGPQGPRGRYEKMRLVPFGEYVPLRPVFGWVTSVTEAAAEDRRRGKDLTIMRTAGVRVGPLVCFESAFTDLSRRLATMGADIIVVQSATSTFQNSWAPDQHAGLAALRAVESGRPVVHATLTGISAAFDASGRELFRMGTRERGAYLTDLPLSRGQTLYSRLGEWVPLGSAAVLLTAALAAGLRAARALPGSAPADLR